MKNWESYYVHVCGVGEEEAEKQSSARWRNSICKCVVVGAPLRKIQQIFMYLQKNVGYIKQEK